MKPRKPKATGKPKAAKNANPKPVPRGQPDVPAPWMVDVLHEKIAIRAYELYERRSRVGPLDDWLAAEREILGELKPGKTGGG